MGLGQVVGRVKVEVLARRQAPLVAREEVHEEELHRVEAQVLPHAAVRGSAVTRSASVGHVRVVGVALLCVALPPKSHGSERGRHGAMRERRGTSKAKGVEGLGVLVVAGVLVGGSHGGWRQGAG